MGNRLRHVIIPVGVLSCVLPGTRHPGTFQGTSRYVGIRYVYGIDVFRRVSVRQSLFCRAIPEYIATVRKKHVNIISTWHQVRIVDVYLAQRFCGVYTVVSGTLLKSCEIQLLSHTRYNISYIAWYNTLEERFNVKNTHISIIHHPSILGTNPTAATLNLTHRNRGYILTQQQYECCCCSCQECVSSSIHSWNKPNLSNVGLKTSKPGIKYITRYYTAAVLLY